MKKGYLQISFAWLFAIIVGGFILVLAIYTVIQIIDSENMVIDAKTGKEIGILLNPLETGFEEGKTSSFTVPVETRIFNECNDNGFFGKQLIRISQKSFKEWTETDVKVGFTNKYIFSEDFVEGKKFYVFSKPFEFPFKVADLIYISSSKDNYCFINPPEEIKEEILDLKPKNLFVENCSENSINVCFAGGSGCDIKVDYDNLKFVGKNNTRMYFEGDALMYAAIFSSPENYECQIKRLMKRVSSLSQLYSDKAAFISSNGCNSNLNLLSLINLANNLENSQEISLIVNDVEKIQKENDLAECKLW
jgi:hypothetical protein